MSNLFDAEEGHFLTMKALKILEKPPEVQKDDDPFSLNGSLVTTIIMVKDEEEYKSGNGIKFQPSYVHQFFREDNTIYGYKDLQITIYISANRLIPYIKINYTEMTEDADDLQECLKKLYEAGYLNDEQQFLNKLNEEQQMSPLGEEIDSFENYKIYKCTSSTPNFMEFKPFLQAFLLILIDGAQYPCDSGNWEYYTLYENAVFVGLTTAYRFCITANIERHRLSQMLLLPSYQRKGLGGKLLQAFYKECWNNKQCIQITLEDPSEDFQVMRDITDCKVLQPHFEEFQNKKILNHPSDLVPLKQEKLKELMKKTKLYSTQIKKAYNIFMYSLINKKARNTMVAFAKEVSQGFQKPYQRPKNILVRFEDGKGLHAKALHLLEMKEKQDQNIDQEELLLDELSFYELIANKLRREQII